MVRIWGRWRFQDFSWSARRGAAWAIIGPSGCGKTTLLYLLAGLRRPQRGEDPDRRAGAPTVPSPRWPDPAGRRASALALGHRMGEHRPGPARLSLLWAGRTSRAGGGDRGAGERVAGAPGAGRRVG
ncbi:MAG: ATP-binding cassette domain-containing protein [Thermoflexus sp.]|nr:ATP-binding cassette domain-containing protein [Thermoflexus sp.]